MQINNLKIIETPKACVLICSDTFKRSSIVSMTETCHCSVQVVVPEALTIGCDYFIFISRSALSNNEIKNVSMETFEDVSLLRFL